MKPTNGLDCPAPCRPTAGRRQRARHAMLVLIGLVSVAAAASAGPATTPSWTADGGRGNTAFGYAARSAGDVNGDGYDDLIVGAYQYQKGEVNEGAAYLYYGSADGLSADPVWMIESDEEAAMLGQAVAGVGDVNGDGYDDVVVGVPLYNSGEGAWGFYGSPDGLSATPDWIGRGEPGSTYGLSLGAAGDVNGDGYDDVIVGDPYCTGALHENGRAYVYHGSPSGLSDTADWVVEGDQMNAYLGLVGAAGDVNGDGYDDVIVGAMGYWITEYASEEGRAYVYYGSPSGLSSEAAWFSSGDAQVGARYGTSVNGAGDVNGDGYDDIVVGALEYDGEFVDEGRAYVYYGSASGPSATADWIADGGQAGAIFGYWVRPAGDVNADGYDDVVIGANLYDNGEEDEGRAYVYCGSPYGLSATADWIGEGNQAGAEYGTGAGAGDVNGDGVDDLVVGACWFDNPQKDEGVVFVYHGAPSP